MAKPNVVHERDRPYHQYAVDFGDGVTWRLSDFYNQETANGNGSFRIREVLRGTQVVLGHSAMGYLIAVKRGAATNDWVGGGHGNCGSPTNFTMTIHPHSVVFTYDLTGYFEDVAVVSQSYTLTLTHGKLTEQVVNTSLVSDLEITIEYRGVLPGPGECYAGGGYNEINGQTGMGCESVSTTNYNLAGSTTLTTAGHFAARVTNDITSASVLAQDRTGNVVKGYLVGTPRSLALDEQWTSTTTFEVLPVPTPTTDYHTIREQWISVIQALTPNHVSGQKFLAYRGGKGEFREWATSSGGAFRRFFIRSSGDIEPPPATDGQVEAMVPAAAVLEMAYPHNWAKYSYGGNLDYHEMERLAIQDANQIRDAIGVNGGANYVTGQSRCDADIQHDLEDDEGVSFLVINLRYIYNRSVS